MRISDWSSDVCSSDLVASGGDRLTFAGDAIFPVGFDHPDWHNGFEHAPEEAVRVRVRLLREAATTGELLVATHLPFPSVGRVAVDADAFRWVAAFWGYCPLAGLGPRSGLDRKGCV